MKDTNISKVKELRQMVMRGQADLQLQEINFFDFPRKRNP
jgi:hypothetical protein